MSNDPKQKHVNPHDPQTTKIHALAGVLGITPAAASQILAGKKLLGVEVPDAVKVEFGIAEPPAPPGLTAEPALDDEPTETE